MAAATRRKDFGGTAARALIVGLGNPGREYERTRHNVGFEVVDELARRWSCDLRANKRDRAVVGEVRRDGELVVLAEPQTFMNLSGESVAPMARRLKVAAPDLIVVHDELDLPSGRLRVKVGGGLAGHNGLRSIKAHLHDDAFVRVRIGVGKPPTKAHGADHVLRKVGGTERSLLDEVVVVAADAVEVILAEGAAAAMTRFNGVDLAAAES